MNIFNLILFIQLISQSNCQYFEYPSEKIVVGIESVTCPDGQSVCPDGETCCLLSSGQYGCCPIPNAVCCEDHQHCCPSGYTCDVQHSRCQKGFQTTHSIVCPGGEMSCSDGETCCQLQSGDYGCCPLPDAVCCNDYSHCCPHGYTCDIEHNKCTKGESIPWFKKKNAIPISEYLSLNLIKFSFSTIQCSDNKSSCPEETTCCQIADGSYGCCPYRRATCCSDKIHCCAEGYSCDETSSRCIKHFTIDDDQQTCPDGKSKCPIESTCCQNKNNYQISYSCCPYSKGVCCGSNGSYCCPNKYICNEEQLSCQLSYENSNKNQHLNKCGTSNVACPLNKTCCKTSKLTNDEYACCDHPNAVCCDDGRHCCPTGTRCQQDSNSCIEL